jgi:hypothetical protein
VAVTIEISAKVEFRRIQDLLWIPPFMSSFDMCEKFIISIHEEGILIPTLTAKLA